jgi:hypothetical protein
LQGNAISLQKNTNIETKTVDITVPDPWITLPPVAPWTVAAPNAPVQIMKTYDGMVIIRGFVTTGLLATQIANIPE